MFNLHLCKWFNKKTVTVGDLLFASFLCVIVVFLCLVASLVTGFIVMTMSDTLFGWSPVDVQSTTPTLWDVCIAIASGAVAMVVWSVTLVKIFDIKIAECPLKKEKQ